MLPKALGSAFFSAGQSAPCRFASRVAVSRCLTPPHRILKISGLGTQCSRVAAPMQCTGPRNCPRASSLENLMIAVDRRGRCWKRQSVQTVIVKGALTAPPFVYGAFDRAPTSRCCPSSSRVQEVERSAQSESESSEDHAQASSKRKCRHDDRKPKQPSLAKKTFARRGKDTAKEGGASPKAHGGVVARAGGGSGDGCQESSEYGKAVMSACCKISGFPFLKKRKDCSRASENEATLCVNYNELI